MRRTTPRKQPKQARARATVDAILTATARVLVREGYDHATTNRIAEVAGVSIGSLYQFFPNKEALFASLRQRHYDDLWQIIGRMEAVRWLPLREAIRSGIGLMLEAHAVDPKLHEILEEQVPATDLERNRDIERRLHALVAETLQARRAELHPSDLDLAAFMIVHAAEALTHGAVVHSPERLRDDRFAEEMTDMIARYLQADAPDTAKQRRRLRRRAPSPA